MLIYTLQIENENEKIIEKIKNFADEIGAKLKINKPQLTENGFTEEFEKELLRELEETERLATEGKIKKYTDIDELFADLEK